MPLFTTNTLARTEVRTVRHTVTLPMNAATDIRIPFAPAFPETNYTVVRDFQAPANLAVGAIEMQRIISRSIDSVTVRMLNSALEEVTITLHVIMIHD